MLCPYNGCLLLRLAGVAWLDKAEVVRMSNPLPVLFPMALSSGIPGKDRAYEPQHMPGTFCPPCLFGNPLQLECLNLKARIFR